MAFIKCSECKKKISDKAVACPTCGSLRKAFILKATTHWLSKPQNIAVLLGALLSVLGKQKFFLKRSAGISNVIILAQLANFLWEMLGKKSKPRKRK